MKNDTILRVIQEAEILGRKIKMYNTIGSPLFMVSDVAEWINHFDARIMLKKIDDRNGINILYQHFMNQGLFKVIKSSFVDGKYRPSTYITKKDAPYITKLLRKYGYLEVA